jgi:hypothetical protein
VIGVIAYLRALRATGGPAAAVLQQPSDPCGAGSGRWCRRTPGLPSSRAASGIVESVTAQVLDAPLAPRPTGRPTPSHHRSAGTPAGERNRPGTCRPSPRAAFAAALARTCRRTGPEQRRPVGVWNPACQMMGGHHEDRHAGRLASQGPVAAARSASRSSNR